MKLKNRLCIWRKATVDDIFLGFIARVVSTVEILNAELFTDG